MTTDEFEPFRGLPFTREQFAVAFPVAAGPSLARRITSHPPQISKHRLRRCKCVYG